MARRFEFVLAGGGKSQLRRQLADDSRLAADAAERDVDGHLDELAGHDRRTRVDYGGCKRRSDVVRLTHTLGGREIGSRAEVETGANDVDGTRGSCRDTALKEYVAAWCRELDGEVGRVELEAAVEDAICTDVARHLGLLGVETWRGWALQAEIPPTIDCLTVNLNAFACRIVGQHRSGERHDARGGRKGREPASLDPGHFEPSS
jgi:hypothetical protein